MAALAMYSDDYNRLWVEVFAVNVGVGDSTIMVLLGDPKVGNRDKVVLKAALIDGGYASYFDSGSTVKIGTLLSFTIPNIYREPGPVKLDSLVITHWHADHYSGVIALLSADIQAQILTTRLHIPPGQRATLEQVYRFVPTDLEASNARCSHLKYNSTGQPLTVLYVPYTVARLGALRPPDSLRFNLDGTVDLNIWMRDEPRVVRSICKFVTDAHEILGVNVFTHDPPPPPLSYASPEALAAAHVNRYRIGTCPGLFIVASNNNIIPALPPVGPPPIPDFFPPSPNDTSIVCLVVFPGPNYRVSYYLAGDAAGDLELRIAAWVNTNVTTMKLSHHGSASSSPLQLLERYRPRTIVVSAGDSHGHPSWQIILLLAWYSNTVGSRLGGKFLWPMRFPYWLRYTGTAYEPFPSSVGAMRRMLTDPATPFQADLLRLLSPVDATEVGRVMTDRTLTDDAVKRLISWWVDMHWERMSFVDVHSSYPRGALYSGEQLDTHTDGAAKEVHYVRIQCDQIETEDGRAGGSSRDKPDIEQLYIWLDTTLWERRLVPLIPFTITTRLAARRRVVGAVPILSLREARLRRIRARMASSRSSSTRSARRRDAPSSSRFVVAAAPVFELFGALPVLSLQTLPVLPLQTLPVLPLQTLPAGYYIYSADRQLPSSTSPGFTAAAATGDLNDLLGDLFTGILMLEAGPPMTGTSSKFLVQDEWASWMIQSLHAMSLSVVWNSSGGVEGFAVEFRIPLNLRYVTTAAILGGPDPAIPALGLLDLGIMVFGLEVPPNAGLNCTLLDVLGFTGFPTSGLYGLTSSIRLVLDTSTKNRNAVWFWPSINYETTIRLQFTLDPREALTVSNFVKDTLGINLTIRGVKVIARRVARKWGLDTEERIRFSSELIFSMTVMYSEAQFQGYLVFDKEYATVIIRPLPTFTFRAILNWIVGLVGNSTVVVDDVMGWVPATAQAPDIRVVQITMQASSAGISGFSVDLQMDITFGGGTTRQKIPFLLRYSWQRGGGQEFSGSLWKPPTPKVTPPDILPEYEDFRILAPVGQDLSPELLLENLLLGGGQRLPERPAELETVIDQLSISLSAGSIEFEGSIIQKSDITPDTDTFVFAIIEVTLSAKIDLTTFDYLVDLTTRITLPPSMVGIPAILFASIRYDKGKKSTTLTGSVTNLNMGSLVQFFPGADGSVVMDIMEHIELRELGLTYEYIGGMGTSFVVKASLVIHVFELDMNFTRESGGWDLDASLRPAPGIRSSIKEILRSLSSDSSIADLIPPFADFEFMGDDIGAPDGRSATTTSGLYLKVNKSNDFLIFRLSLLLKGSAGNPSLRFTFFQIKRLGEATADLPLKRIVRISIESLPFGSNLSVPLVGQLNQPFDELDYLWIHDPSEEGLTLEEIQSINSDAADFGELRYKETKLPQDLVPNDILLAAGSHFIVTMRHPSQNTPPSVVLDYVFGRPTDPPENPENPGSADPPAQTDAAPAQGEAEPPTSRTANPEPTKGDTTMAKLEKSQGPLSIANFGLRYSNKTLHIVFDATVKLGPIEFSLLGFGLSLQFTENVSLRSLSSARFGVEISGLAVAFDKPPTLIEGMFIRESTVEVERYTGGVVVSFAPYSFEAVGSYGELNRSGTKFVFIFGKLNGPLITLGFAEITGISLGFGYNTRLRLPTLDNVNSFPFLKPSPPPAGTLPAGTPPAPDPGPLKLLGTFNDWITPHDGSFWIAAGLEMRAFQCLDIDAVVTLQFEPEVTIGIIAKAIASLPTTKTPDPTKSFVYAEIGLVATLNVHAGVLRVEAKLSPNSFVLNPACHLRGGFALCYWFLGSGHEGDWVFSVGGYHPAFTPPAHYPVPERLGISWQLSDHLSVTGEAYFAITPKVCMGGGSLSAVFSLSPLYAYFHAYADFLINYSPFHFLGSVGVSVGVHFTIDLWICTIDINIDVSASLDLYGPPLGGVVHVNFYVFGFSVHFGDESPANDAITLAEFWYLAQQQTASEKAAVTATTSGNSKSGHVLSVVTGRYPGKNKSTETPEGEPWVVRRGGFKFSAQSQFPIRSAICNHGPPADHQTAIYAKPMHLVGGSSGKSDENGGQWVESTMTISVVEGTVPVLGFTCAPIVKKVPSALWGKYVAGEDPRAAGSNVQNLLTHNDDLTIDLMMGVTVSAPPPFLSLDLVKPFEAARAMAKDVFVDADPFHPELPLTPLPVAAGPWRPAPLDIVADMPAKPWENARDVWSTPTTGDEDIKTLVDACMGAFGWTLDLSPAAHIPQLLIDALETEYLQPPLIGIGVVP